MTSEIELRKANYWRRVHTLPESRWAHQALREVIKMQYKSNWLKSTLEAWTNLGLQQGTEDTTKKRTVKTGAVKKEQRIWDETKRSSPSLGPHPKNRLMDVEAYIWEDTKACKSLTKLRLGDIGRKWIPNQTCHTCTQDGIDDMRDHILLDCPQLEQARSGYIRQTITTCQRIGFNRLQTTRELLASTSREGRICLHGLYTTWGKDNPTETKDKTAMNTPGN